MTTQSTDTMIASLGADLRPVRRLARPGWRIVIWLLIGCAAAAMVAHGADLAGVAARLTASPDMWLAVAGSVLTAITAAVATFLVSLPDRPARWAWLPVPFLLLWIGANGLGCLRGSIPGLHPAGMMRSADDCLPFILELSVPLAAAMLLLLRPVATIRPELTTLTGGLAIAATAASVLWLDHPFDAGVADLLVHTLAVMLVVAAMRLGGSRLLSPAQGPRSGTAASPGRR